MPKERSFANRALEAALALQKVLYRLPTLLGKPLRCIMDPLEVVAGFLLYANPNMEERTPPPLHVPESLRGTSPEVN